MGEGCVGETGHGRGGRRPFAQADLQDEANATLARARLVRSRYEGGCARLATRCDRGSDADEVLLFGG